MSNWSLLYYYRSQLLKTIFKRGEDGSWGFVLIPKRFMVTRCEMNEISSLHFKLTITSRHCQWKLGAWLHWVGRPQVGEVTHLVGVTHLSFLSVILIWSRLHDRWGDPPHVTSPIWGPPPSCKQALKLINLKRTTKPTTVYFRNNFNSLTKNCFYSLQQCIT